MYCSRPQSYTTKSYNYRQRYFLPTQNCLVNHSSFKFSTPRALTTKSAFVSWQKHLLEALLRRYGTKICEREKTYDVPMKFENRNNF